MEAMLIAVGSLWTIATTSIIILGKGWYSSVNERMGKLEINDGEYRDKLIEISINLKRLCEAQKIEYIPYNNGKK